MKKILFFLIPLICFSQDYKKYMNKGFSQEKEGKIYGKIKDEKGRNLQYANVQLFQNDSIIEGLISDEKGRFLFEDIQLGEYTLYINFVGYERINQNLNLTKEAPVKNLKTISLTISSNMLQETNLVDEKPIYENKFEKIVYNVENDLSQNAIDAVDVLTQTPLLDVDIEGNVSLRGENDIKFLINGKESSFLKGNNVSDVLKMIPSEQIKSVEVITSPTAKYSGEGTAGIVNIITKQDKLEGFTAGVSTSTGTRVNRTNGNFSYGNSKFGISGKVGGRYGWPREGKSNYFRETFDDLGFSQSILESTGKTIGNWVGHNSSLDAYYEFNPQLNILSSFWYGGYRKTNEGESNYNSSLQGDYNVFQESLNSDTELEWTTDLIKKFLDNEDRELRMAFQLARHFHDDESFSGQGFSGIDVAKPLPQESVFIDSLSYDNFSDGTGKEYTFQLDYVHPLSEKNKIELGGKYINRFTTVDYRNIEETFYSDDVLNQENLNLIENSDEIFSYDQSVWAGYLSSSMEFPRDISLILGARYEGTRITGDYEVNSQVIPKNIYHTFLPSFVLAKKLDFSKTLKFSYSKRLMRPDIHYINPNLVFSDSKNIRIGNPELNPEITQQLELGFSSFKPGFMTSYFVYYKRTDDIIEDFITVSGDTSITNYLNIGTNNSFGINFFGSIRIPNVMNIRAGGDFYTYNVSSSEYSNIYNSEIEENVRFVYKWYLNSTIDLGKKYSFECRGWYRSPRQTIQGTIPSFSMVSFGLKKEFNNKRGSIGIGLIEPWSKYKSFETDLSGDNFIQTSNNQILFRSIQINFKYKFGKLKFDPIKSKSGINNNDLKQEDGGGDF